METKEYSLKINSEANLIVITGITSNAISIDFSGDIDFTKLVSELTQSIDSKTLLAPKGNNDTSDESTLKLILETIESIIQEYNHTVASLVEDIEEDEDFEVETEHEPNMVDEGEDLPF
ncbi:MAG: hypothetical protein JNK09_10360 [Prolixibacteraceae bacterium]|nr:hypothetical protein [Prolixibacteraceae bacterium]